MSLNSGMSTRVLAGLAIAPLAGLPAANLAQTPKKAAQHFSISGKRPTFHEDDID